MNESTVILVAVAIGILVGGVGAWFVRAEIGRRRLLELQSQWQMLHRKAERQRDDSKAKLGDALRELRKAETDLRDQARRSVEALGQVHEKELRIRELEEGLQEDAATCKSQEAVIELLRGQLDRAEGSSPARQGETAATPPGTGADGADDLKQIRGIGPAFEKKLHALGVTRFEQIARWDADRILEISEQLGVAPGRIERDDWVVGAKYRLMAKSGFQS